MIWKTQRQPAAHEGPGELAEIQLSLLENRKQFSVVREKLGEGDGAYREKMFNAIAAQREQYEASVRELAAEPSPSL